MELKDIITMFDESQRLELVDESVLVAHLTSLPDKSGSFRIHKPEQLVGMSVILVLEGSLEVEINMEPFTLTENSLIVVPPGAVFCVRSDGGETGEAYMLYMSTDFLSDLNINYGALTLPVSAEKPSPVRQYDRAQIEQLQRFFAVIMHSAEFKVSPRLQRNLVSSLVSAFVYQVAQFYVKSLERKKTPASENSRPSGYVQEFLHLLQIHYMKERSVAFYASKLFISPKYLSLLVKKATGRSASRWIDDRVILEARNLLRFSGKNIQQIAYMLNFSNQSAFGKYFKHITGMSPTEYQKN